MNTFTQDFVSSNPRILHRLCVLCVSIYSVSEWPAWPVDIAPPWPRRMTLNTSANNLRLCFLPSHICDTNPQFLKVKDYIFVNGEVLAKVTHA